MNSQCLHWAKCAFTPIMVVVGLSALTLCAQNASPVGLWKSIDDETKKATALVRVWEQDTRLYGKVEKLFPDPGEDPNPRCGECEGEKKDQPIMGMTILWGLKKDGDSWSGGYVLDPDTGKTHKCKVKIRNNGKTLEVRGYVGVPMMGRSQYWIRIQ